MRHLKLQPWRSSTGGQEAKRPAAIQGRRMHARWLRAQARPSCASQWPAAAPCCGMPCSVFCLCPRACRQVQALRTEKQQRIEATQAELLRMGATGTITNGEGARARMHGPLAWRTRASRLQEQSKAPAACPRANPNLGFNPCSAAGRGGARVWAVDRGGAGHHELRGQQRKRHAPGHHQGPGGRGGGAFGAVQVSGAWRVVHGRTGVAWLGRVGRGS